MTATRVAPTTEGTDATQAVQRLPGRVFNAENVTMTDEGRIFVTGSEAVYEWTSGTLNIVPVEILPQDCMKNGISTGGRFLYLACTRIHGGDKPLLPKSWCDVSSLEQAPLNFIRMLLTEKILYQADSVLSCVDGSRPAKAFSMRHVGNACSHDAMDGPAFPNDRLI